MNLKSILSLTLVLFTIFSTIGSAFAGANIGVKFDKEQANVGDTINLIITITNTGPDDLSNVFVYAPLPTGLQLMSYSTGTSKNLYNSGVWEVDNLRLSSKGGGVKTLTINAVVGPELADKTVIANAHYISVSSGDPPVPLNNLDGSSTSLKVSDIVSATINGTGNYTNNSNGNNSTNPNNSTNNDTDNSKINDTGNITNNSTNSLTNGTINLNNLNKNQKNDLESAINSTNAGNSELNNILPASQSKSEKAYEIDNSPNPVNDSSYTVYVVGLLAILALIAIGYFYGVKK